MSWPMVALGDVCEVVGGGTPKTSRVDYWGGDVLWATPKDLSEQRSRHMRRTGRSITEAGLKSCGAQVLRPRSVLLSSRAPIGLVAVNAVAMATNQGFKSLVPNAARVDADFLAHWLAGHTAYLQSLGTGATFKEISKSVVVKIEIPLPPLDEQRRIARVLDAADRLKATRRAALTRFDALASAHFISSFGEPDENPYGWDVRPVSALVSSFDGGKSFAGEDDDDLHAPYRVLRVSAVTSGEFRPEESRPVPRGYTPPSRHRVRLGDLLISRANTSALVGAVALVDDASDELLLPDKIWRFSWRDGEAAVPEFVWQLFRTRAVRSAISRRSTGTSGSMKNISAEKLMGIEVIQPPVRRQLEFAGVFRHTRRLRAHAARQLSHLDALFASLQHRAFTGAL